MDDGVGPGDPTYDERGRTIRQLVKRRRHLPHWDEPDATYFVTFCLKQGVVANLTQPDLAQLIVDALRFFDGERYWLYDYTVMPDHVHAILQPVSVERRTEPLRNILGSLKSWTARRVNALLGRQGPLWQDETYDRIIRDEREYDARATYILENARIRGLVDHALDWPWWGQGRCRS
jgi:REP element-mobilizing transposase RayT